MHVEFIDSASGYRFQKTLKRTVGFSGIGLHSGVEARIELSPAPVNHGIVFRRADLFGHPKIPAHYRAVCATRMATSLGLEEYREAKVGTVEHLMAALYGIGITNVLIDVWGPEIPILDGSAWPFFDAFANAGIELQNYSQPILTIKKPIRIRKNDTICELLPRESLRLTTSVEFSHPLIGIQTFALELTPKSFLERVCKARTFGFARDLSALRQAHLALGASLDNVLAFSEDSVLNREGVRFPDECVRHKLLDAIGDLALVGCWIQGELVSYRGGHSIHRLLLESLKSYPNHWELQQSVPLHARTAKPISQPVYAP